MSTDAVIDVHGLEKSYRKLKVLRGVDFAVARGSIFALLGSSGAGKTTAIRILASLLKADAGTAKVDDFDVAKRPANVRESISLTGQFAAGDEILSGRENLVLVARLRHLKNAGKIADELLARFQLTDAADRKVSTYSGGMRRRLDIGMTPALRDAPRLTARQLAEQRRVETPLLRARYGSGNKPSALQSFLPSFLPASADVGVAAQPGRLLPMSTTSAHLSVLFERPSTPQLRNGVREPNAMWDARPRGSA